MVEEKNTQPKEEEKQEQKEAEQTPKKEEVKTEEKTLDDSQGKSSDEKEVEVPKKFQKIVEEIEQMKVVDLAELVKILEKKFGVSAQAPVAMMGAAPGAAASEAAGGEEEKSEYDIVLTAVGDKKIDVIKVVRDATGKGLKEAKDMVDAAASEPQTVKEKAKKAEAEEMKAKFEEAGAKIELK